MKNRNSRFTLITGGSSGIGLALAECLNVRGDTVLIVGRNAGRMEAALARCPGLVSKICDVSDPAQSADLARWVAGHYGQLDTLINNAGVCEPCLFHRDAQAADKVQREIETNLLGPVHLTHLLLPILISNRPATIVNVTSGYAIWPCSSAPRYSASKSGLSAFTFVLREQLRDSGVRVMEVCPPMVDTPMTAEARCPKISPERVAGEIIHGMDRRRERVLIGQSRALAIAGRFLPGLTRTVMNRYPVSLRELRQKYGDGD
jgi:uncharacterized oxidoreductase